jgi:hypothetical protein
MELIDCLARPELVLNLLAEINADPETLALIAGRSYRHVNHFDKIVLVDTGNIDQYRLTLHLWQPPYSGSDYSDELIHDHRFSFWSNILVGTLKSQNFTMSDSGHRYRTYRYRPEKQATSTVANRYEFAGYHSLETSELNREVAGNSYYLDYSQVHRVLLPHHDMTCTLVLRGPREREYSSIYNTTYPTQDSTAMNQMFSPASLHSKLDGLAREIEHKRLATR